ncbi:hypothetical protein [Dysgonomonas sp.]
MSAINFRCFSSGNFFEIEYQEWMLKSFDWHAANMNLKQAIEGSM